MKTTSKTLLVLSLSIELFHVNGAETDYFLVSARRWGDCALVFDSYVLPLSKQEDIDHARYLISLGCSVSSAPHETIVSAKVGPGKDGINRDYFDPTFREWSWHIIQFWKFADYSADIYNGSPTELENDPPWYLGIDGRQGIIAFWAYTVVRELGPAPLYLSMLSDGQNLQFYWSAVVTNQVYTLEGNESLESTNWFALPGASWPLATNHWSLPLSNATASFYRVRAEQ